MKKSTRFIARAEPGNGWRVWDRKLNRPWGMYQKQYPEQILSELNTQRRGEVLDSLLKKGK